jgi:hypothetical protein
MVKADQKTGKGIDWESLRQEWEAGTTSGRALANKHGVHESAIRKRAARDAKRGKPWSCAGSGRKVQRRAKPGGTDWEALEREWRTDTVSNCVLAAKYNVTESAIRKRARRYGWKRDLRQQMETASARALIEDVAQSGPGRGRDSHLRPRDADADTATVQMAAGAHVLVVRGHRSSLARLRALAERLAGELESVTERTGWLDDVIHEVTSEDRTQERANALRYAVGLSSRAKVLRDLANATRLLVLLERQAVGLPMGDPRDRDGDAPPVRVSMRMVLKGGDDDE